MCYIMKCVWLKNESNYLFITYLLFYLYIRILVHDFNSKLDKAM